MHRRWLRDLLAGVTVALISLPASLAFGVASGSGAVTRIRLARRGRLRVRVPVLTRLGVGITVGMVAATGCAGSPPKTVRPGEVAPGSSGSLGKANSIEIPVDLKEVEELQRAFDEGHQPWRGDPIFVAHVAIISILDRNARYEDLKVERKTDTEAVVAGKGMRYRYRVRLRRLVAPGRGRYGIWTAVRVEYEPAGE